MTALFGSWYLAGIRKQPCCFWFLSYTKNISLIGFKVYEYISTYPKKRQLQPIPSNYSLYNPNTFPQLDCLKANRCHHHTKSPHNYNNAIKPAWLWNTRCNHVPIKRAWKSTLLLNDPNLIIIKLLETSPLMPISHYDYYPRRNCPLGYYGRIFTITISRWLTIHWVPAYRIRSPFRIALNTP